MGGGTFNNQELFVLLFTTNLFGLAIQRRVSSKEVVPTRKKRKNKKKKEITLVLTAGREWRRHADNQKGV